MVMRWDPTKKAKEATAQAMAAAPALATAPAPAQALALAPTSKIHAKMLKILKIMKHAGL